MRTLKKALSLVLVLAMVLSLGVSAFAVEKAADYSDYADVKNTEAVDVLTAIGVLNGNDDGTFGPEGNFTRAAAAKIIAYMTLGATIAEALPATATQFSDVPATHWASKYIQYCVDEGIIGGNGDGTFAPEGTLTAAAWSKMLLCALGYDATIEKMVGTGWEIAATRLAMKAGVASADDLAGTFNRDAAAKLAFNTLSANMVEYATTGTSIIIGDTTVNTGASKAEPVTTTEAYGANISNDSAAGTLADPYVVQFAEQNFKKLVKDTGANSDDFGRPGYTWKLDNKAVSFGASKAVVTYSASMNYTAGKKQIASDLKGYKFNGTELKTVTDTITTGATIGDLALANGDNIVDGIAALTANGKVVEVYANSTTKVVTDVNVITYSVGKVTGVSTNKAGDVTYTITGAGSLVDYADNYVKGDDQIVVHGTIAKNDFVTYVAGVNAPNAVHVFPTTKITGTQTASTAGTLTIGGSKYNLGLGVTGYNSYTYANTSKDANYYLDQFGFVVASSDVTAELVYAVVNKIAAKSVTTGLTTGKSAEAEIVLTDGTKSTVAISKINGIEVKDFSIATGALTWTNHEVSDVAVSDTVASNTALNGKIVSYVVDSNGKYELTYVEAPTSVTTATAGVLVNKGVPAIGAGQVGATAGTTETVYVVKTKNAANNAEVFTSYTGFANVPTIKAASAQTLTAQYVVSNSKTVFVYIDAYTNSEVGETAAETNIFYAANATVTTVGTGASKYYTIDGILNGEPATIKSTVADFKVVGGSAPSAKTFYKLTVNENGYVTSATSSVFDANGTADEALVTGIAGGSFAGYLWNSNTKVYVIDNGEASVGAVESITVGDKWFVVLPSTGTAAQMNTISTLYIEVAE